MFTELKFSFNFLNYSELSVIFLIFLIKFNIFVFERNNYYDFHEKFSKYFKCF
jgi:membrane-bound metal-dependent hydrolase YbcI (DUF457 family)